MSSTACPVFGPIILGSDVEQWCIDHCQRWLSTYMSEAERQHGIPALTLARPRSYTRSMLFDAWAEDQLPRLIIVSPGVVPPPTRHADGYTARWAIGLAVHFSAATALAARDGAQLMTGAARELFKDKPSLGGYALAADWADERYDDLPFDDSRSHSSGQAHFVLEVDHVGDAYGGPATPDTPSDDPWTPWPQVDTADVQLENHPVSAPLP